MCTLYTFIFVLCTLYLGESVLGKLVLLSVTDKVNISLHLQCLRYKILPSGLWAEICCKRGGKGLSGRIGTFSGPILEQIGTFIVICTKMPKTLVPIRTKSQNRDLRASTAYILLVTLHIIYRLCRPFSPIHKYYRQISK